MTLQKSHNKSRPNLVSQLLSHSITWLVSKYITFSPLGLSPQACPLIDINFHIKVLTFIFLDMKVNIYFFLNAFSSMVSVSSVWVTGFDKILLQLLRSEKSRNFDLLVTGQFCCLLWLWTYLGIDLLFALHLSVMG